MVGEIKVEVPEGLPLNDLKKKIIKLIKEEEAKLTMLDEPKDKDHLQREERKKVLDKYYGIIKLDRTVNIEEILDLEEEAWRY
jgi:hypothetical protein